jgi:uncharacterized damage-inducible protein DinB
MNVQGLLTSPLAYMPPAQALDGLTSADAERRAGGLPHSIAEVVAHLSFWQSWFHARCAGRPEPMASAAAQGWPAVAGGSWPDVHARFLSGLAALAEFGEATPGDRLITPPIEFRPLAGYTIGEALVHVAAHNAHHLGQVILLRQLQGTWPPPAGSWTW